ncbi:PLP-dependent aminotransferase family protein [Noviherbaspirillum cavernae]|uniref:PLP-dependent aminotransferase family protein n=1 Tax=Noviherbaspirillum cavernae TaxID=2320862 RepID=A0A418WX55_9BURK|nr:PLP-dependent aminotransferase family protein [Noviherbaspirillum cavernae]RJG04820.1 PLP-dependent aminotransferase family protein [Noviherbaspirillum cavernae]
MDSQTLYRQLADHYLAAIKAGTLAQGERMPSVRSLMRKHAVSLSTALQSLRQLESEGWVEARPRSGYFVRRPWSKTILPLEEPSVSRPPDPAQYVGIHARVSEFIAQGRRHPVKVNLSGARAAPELYPAEELKNAAIRALRREPGMLVRGTSPGGNAHFRTVLARRAMESGMVLSPDDITVTHGCSEGLNLALRAVAQAGDVIAVESPAYFGLLQILESLGLRALEIPTSATTGLSLDALELAMRTYDNIKAVVVVPHLQNPLGSIMPDEHKRRLVQLCERRAVPLIEDDCYSDLVDVAAPLNAVKSWDRSGNVIHCASLSKTLAPGMRLGWMVAGRWQARVTMLKYAQSHDNEEWSQLAAADYIASPAFERHLRRLRTALRQQRERVAEAIATAFPSGTRLNMPDGGLTLWLELPNKLSSDKVFEAAMQEGILVAPGAMFSNSSRFDHFLRISCGFPHTRDIEEAMRRLGGIVAMLSRKAA